MSVNSSDYIAGDGTVIAVHETGQGRPLLLLHGLFSSAATNWIRFGHAEKLSAAGYHVIMPDFRVHGDSEAPLSPDAYPQDILVEDMTGLIMQRGLKDFDLGGFSLGARTAAKILTRGIRPRRTMLMGMGWEGLGGWGNRLQFFVDAIDKREEVKQSDPHWMAVNFMKSQKIDPAAARLLLNSFGKLDTESLTRIDLPVGVICGVDDTDNGSAPDLAQHLRQGSYIGIPGEHMSSVTKPDFSDAMVRFLTS